MSVCDIGGLQPLLFASRFRLHMRVPSIPWSVAGSNNQIGSFMGLFVVSSVSVFSPFVSFRLSFFFFFLSLTCVICTACNCFRCFLLSLCGQLLPIGPFIGVFSFPLSFPLSFFFLQERVQHWRVAIASVCFPLSLAHAYPYPSVVRCKPLLSDWLFHGSFHFFAVAYSLLFFFRFCSTFFRLAFFHRVQHWRLALLSFAFRCRLHMLIPSLPWSFADSCFRTGS